MFGDFLLDDPPMAIALSDRIMTMLAASDKECKATRKMPEEAQKLSAV
jgi:hypothetical protein